MNPTRSPLDLARDRLAGHKAKVLLLTCIDFRFHQDIARVMRDVFGYQGQYDQFILAGASLGAQLTFGPDRKPHWQQTFVETLAFAVEAHGIDGLVVMDHMDCGAYKRYWNSMGAGPYSPGKEAQQHDHFMGQLAALVRNETRVMKPDFFTIKWLLPVPEADDSGLEDPSRWSLQIA